MKTIANKIAAVIIVLGVLAGLACTVYESHEPIELVMPKYNKTSFDRTLFTDNKIIDISSNRHLIVLDEEVVYFWLSQNGTKIDIHQLTAINHGAMGCTSSLMIIYSER